MTRRETGAIMDILSVAYPRFYANGSAERAVALWAEMFAEDDVRIVAAAVKALIATDEKGFPPHVGAVKASIRRITRPDEMTEAEAWGVVRKAICNSTYHAQHEFDAMPEIIRRLVGAPSQLREWAMMDADTVASVVASNFQRSYRARAAGEREFLAMPEDVKKLALEIGRAISGQERTGRELERPREAEEENASLPPPRRQAEPAEPLTEQEWNRRREEMKRKIEAYG